MTRKSEEREKRLISDLEPLRSQQEQTFGSLDTRLDVMLVRLTQAIMNRLDRLLGGRSGSKRRTAQSREASRDPRVNFNKHPRRGRTNGYTRGRGNSYSHVDGNNRPRNPTKIRRDSIGSRSISNKRPTRDTNASGRYDSTNWNHSDQGRAQPSDSDRRDIPEPQTTDGDTQAGYSRAATLWAPETLNRSLELSSRGCPGPVSVARNPEGRLRNGNAND